MIHINQLDHIALGVKDLEESIAWYQEILGLKKLQVREWGDFPVFMVSSDNSGLALFPSKIGNPAKMPQNRKSGLPHVAFQVDRENFDQAQEFLGSKGIEFEFQDHFNAHSIYFRDPDDYCIELTTYEVN